MAVNNKLAPTDKKNEVIASYTVDGTSIELTPTTVKNYFVSGDKDRVTMAEVIMYTNLCKFNGLNPWLKEAYCIKYGNEPATMVVGKEAFMKRAEANPNYDGSEAGVIAFDESLGELTYRKGAFTLPGEQIVGGYAEVWRKDRSHSTRIEVTFDEYVGRKKDGSLNSQWVKKPGTMIRKVALVQALREAFPNTLGGVFTAEEQGYDEQMTAPEFDPERAKDAIEAEIIVEQPSNSAENALFGE